MNVEITQERLKSGIKFLLKKHGYTYHDLAEVLGCSIATAKRIMNQEELSLSRLLTTLDWLGVSLSDLEKLIQDDSHSANEFTKEQDDFLAEHPHYLSFLMELYTPKSPAKIAKEHNLNQKAVDKYLLKLEQLELIRVTATGKVKPAADFLPSFRYRGKLAKLYYDKLIDRGGEFYKKVIEKGLFSLEGSLDEKSPPLRYSMTIHPMTEKSYRDAVHQLDQVYENIRFISNTESRIKNQKDLKNAVLLVAYTYVPDNDPSLNQVTSLFGEIPNI